MKLLGLDISKPRKPVPDSARGYAGLPDDVKEEIAFKQRQLIAQSLSDLAGTSKERMGEIEAPQDYDTQLARARAIWNIYGVAAQWPDPYVTVIMDTMVSTTVAFGSENLFKKVPQDGVPRKVLDHWCAEINSGKPMLTPGLDSFREQFHKMRWCDGGVVVAWSVPEPMETWDGIKYQAPKLIALYPRDKFYVKASSKYGGFEIYWREELGEQVETQGSDLAIDETPGQIENFIKNGRYFVADRGRVEAAQMYPVPFLVQRGLTNACARKRAMERSDFQTAIRLIRAILAIKQGGPEWLGIEGIDPLFFQKRLDQIKDDLKAEDGDYASIVTGDASLSLEWSIPELQALMSAEKYDHDAGEILAGLGIIEIQGTGQRRRYAYNPKPMLIEVMSAMQADRRLMENILFPIVWESNKEIFKGISPANFHQKPLTLFMEPEAMALILKLFEYGVMSYGSTYEQIVGFGADIESEKARSEYEKESGFDEIFERRIDFSQTVVNPSGKPREKEEDDDDEDAEAAIESARQTGLAYEYDALREQVLNVARTDASEKDKKAAIKALVVSAFVAMSMGLQTRLRQDYKDRFDGPVLSENLFESYVGKTGQLFTAFGNDMVSGLSDGASLAGDEAEAFMRGVFGGKRYRMSLYDSEPFRVAAASAQAAVAMDAGMEYAVRHSSFGPTTCQECIDKHGDIMPIKQVFAGEWDHPHGECWFSFHKTQVQASQEVKEMLTIDEMNRLCAVADALFEDIAGDN